MERKILYFLNLSASQLKRSFRYAKEIIQPVCIWWLVFLRLSMGPLIVMVYLAVRVLELLILGTMNYFSPEMKKEV